MHFINEDNKFIITAKQNNIDIHNAVFTYKSLYGFDISHVSYYDKRYFKI